LELESKQTSENQKKKICADKRGLSTIPLGDKISSDFQKKYQGFPSGLTDFFLKKYLSC